MLVLGGTEYAQALVPAHVGPLASESPGRYRIDLVGPEAEDWIDALKARRPTRVSGAGLAGILSEILHTWIVEMND